MGLHWVLLDNPGQSPHCRSLILIPSGKPILHVTYSQVLGIRVRASLGAIVPHPVPPINFPMVTVCQGCLTRSGTHRGCIDGHSPQGRSPVSENGRAGGFVWHWPLGLWVLLPDLGPEPSRALIAASREQLTLLASWGPSFFMPQVELLIPTSVGHPAGRAVQPVRYRRPFILPCTSSLWWWGKGR